MKYLKQIINELFLFKPWSNTTITNRKIQISWSILTIISLILLLLNIIYIIFNIC